MLKVELTENYAGVKISGDWDDLNNLYDSILYYIKNDSSNLKEAIIIMVYKTLKEIGLV